MKIRHAVAASLIAFALPVIANDAVPLKACSEDADSEPWLYKDRPGLNNVLLGMAEKKYGAKIEQVKLPWKRCLEEAKNGTVDGIFKISYSAERSTIYAYPMKGDKPDDSKRINVDSYSLFRVKGSNVSWDGKVLKADGPVAAQSGFSIVNQLKDLGAKVDDGSKPAADNLRKLMDGRVVAVALQTDEGNSSLAENPQFAAKLERITPVLVEKPYYLALSKQFYAKNPKAAEALWSAIGAARESAEYKEAFKKFK